MIGHRVPKLKDSFKRGIWILQLSEKSDEVRAAAGGQGSGAPALFAGQLRENQLVYSHDGGKVTLWGSRFPIHHHP